MTGRFKSPSPVTNQQIALLFIQLFTLKRDLKGQHFEQTCILFASGVVIALKIRQDRKVKSRLMELVIEDLRTSLAREGDTSQATKFDLHSLLIFEGHQCVWGTREAQQDL